MQLRRNNNHQLWDGKSECSHYNGSAKCCKPDAVLFLGKCGGLKKKNKLGDLILPIAAIRSDGTSNDYLPNEVPALPAFKLQIAISNTITRYNWNTGQVLYIPQTEGSGAE